MPPAKALSATKATPANIKKVARELAVDAVVEAIVTERRGGLRVRIRLRDGVTGVSVEALDVTMTGTRFDKSSVRDIKAELIDVISSLDEDDDVPRARKKRKR
jgi:TolB-like protein